MSSGLFHTKSGAKKPFASIQIAATASHDLDEITRRWAWEVDRFGGESVIVTLGDASHASERYEGWGQHFWRVWWEPSFRYRDELTIPGVPASIAIVRENVRMMYLAGDKTLYTNEPASNNGRWEIVTAPSGSVELPTLENRAALFPLIHPPLPEVAWQFTTIADEEEYDGRVTRRVRATRRIGAAASNDRPHPGFNLPYVDEYECIVDDERQIMLRLSAIYEGAAIVVVTADEVRLDSILPPDAFEFTSPDGTRVIYVERSD